MLSFSRAMDAVGLTAPEAAEIFGVATQTIRQMRLEPNAPSARTPPPDWPAKLAAYARKKSKALAKLADEIERIG